MQEALPQKVKTAQITKFKAILLIDCDDEALGIKKKIDSIKEYLFELNFTNDKIIFRELLVNIKPDIVIYDLDLKYLNVIESIEFCKMFYSEIPFIIISDVFCNDKAIQYIELGATDFLLKQNLDTLPTAIFKAFKQNKEKKAIRLEKQKRWEDSQRFKGLIEHSQDPVIAYDIDGTVTYVSPAISKVLGYTVDEFIGTNVKDYIFENDLENREEIFRELVNVNKKFVVIEEERLIHKNGHVVWVRAVISDARLTPGIEGFITNFRDITDRKRKTQELQDSFELVKEQNERMLNFSYIVSHNLRSHCSNIQSIVGFMETAANNSEKHEMLFHLKNASNSLNQTLFNLNEVVSIQSNTTLKVETISLLPFMEQIIVSLNNKIWKFKATINFKVSKEISIKYNKGYLESILQNIILNSIKYRHPLRDPKISITCKEQDNYLILSIADNGLGIDLKKNKHKLFGMYKTFHGNEDAFGLGLFMSKNQVEAMGGKIEVESILEEGTTFKIYIKR